MSIQEIWDDSDALNRFRGDTWMKEPCRSCPEKSKDFGGCRCQAYMLTSDPANADPVCSLSPQHNVVLDAIESAATNSHSVDAKPIVFRNPKNSIQMNVKTTQSELAQRNPVFTESEFGARKK